MTTPKERKYYLDGVIDSIVISSNGKVTVEYDDNVIVWRDIDFGRLRYWWLPRFLWILFPAEWKLRRFVNALWAGGKGKFYEPTFDNPAIDKYSGQLKAAIPYPGKEE